MKRSNSRKTNFVLKLAIFLFALLISSGPSLALAEEAYHSLEEKKKAGLGSAVAENITLGGLLEVEFTNEDNERDGVGSDITLATVEVAIDAKINENVEGHILFLWEEDGGPIALDEGTITINSSYGLSLTAGKQYVPFGNFESHFVSDPQTLELGETNQSAVLLGYEKGPVEIALGLFNGDLDGGNLALTDNDRVDNYVASVKVAPVDGVSFGLSWISDLADTDAEITEAWGASPTLGYLIDDSVAGISAFLSLAFGPVAFEAEYLGALDEFDVLDLDVDTDLKGDKPSTYNVEVAYEVNDNIEVALRYEGNTDLFELPETQYGVAASYEVFENTNFSVEYLQGEYDDTGNLEEKRTLITAQIAVEF
ncbi:MAG: LbtU family siderophore porin [Deltaproteobacteria bacterium]|nr:LbtU family siderophore porin [Deltaproteobacteria bacterium]